MTDTSVLFEPVKAGAIELKNRLVQAPMGRLRAETDGTPTDIMVEYFRQRAGMGLITTDGTSPSLSGRVGPYQPGIFKDEHVPAWKAVTDAVHAEGGKIVVQLMHGGWNVTSQLTDLPVLAPSAVDHQGAAFTKDDKPVQPETPIAMSEEQLAEVRDDFVTAARRAIDAGFDGVEVHAANGYLLHAFLGQNTNLRDDEWGGTPEKRAAYPLSVTRAIVEEIGADRTGIRLCPGMSLQGVEEDNGPDSVAVYTPLLHGLNELGIAYISLEQPDLDGELAQLVRNTFHGTIFANNTMATEYVMDRERAVEIASGKKADAVVVGRAVIANPDLAARWKTGAEENTPDMDTFYTHDAKGFTDYPTLS